jgi:hypothetical protein
MYMDAIVLFARTVGLCTVNANHRDAAAAAAAVLQCMCAVVQPPAPCVAGHLHWAAWLVER